MAEIRSSTRVVDAAQALTASTVGITSARAFCYDGLASPEGHGHGAMHGTSTRPSLIERCSGLPRMRWPVWSLRRVRRWLQKLRGVLVSELLVGEHRGRPEQRRRVR